MNDTARALETVGRTSPAFRTFNVDSLGEFLQRDIPPLEQVLAPWLPMQGLTMVYAARGVGKTFFALNVAYAVASGGSFLNWSAPKPRGVLYIDGEMPAVAMQERLANIVACITNINAAMTTARWKSAASALHLRTY